MATYSFAFFFGPGLALDFASPSTPAPSSLFAPILGPGSPFWALSSAGNGLIVGTAGTGVAAALAFASDLPSTFVSAEVATTTVATGFGVEGKAFIVATLRAICS